MKLPPAITRRVPILSWIPGYQQSCSPRTRRRADDLGLLVPEMIAYADLAAGLVVITGLASVLAGLCRLGFITEFLSGHASVGHSIGNMK